MFQRVVICATRIGHGDVVVRAGIATCARHGMPGTPSRDGMPGTPDMPDMPIWTVLAVQNCSELFRTVWGGLVLFY